jgi:hypothetical protein
MYYCYICSGGYDGSDDLFSDSEDGEAPVDLSFDSWGTDRLPPSLVAELAAYKTPEIPQLATYKTPEIPQLEDTDSPDSPVNRYPVGTTVLTYLFKIYSNKCKYTSGHYHMLSSVMG